MGTLADLAAVLVPVYACTLGGVLWARLARPIDLEFVATFVYVIGAPALVFAAVMRAAPGSVPVALIAKAALLSLALGGVIAVLVSLAAGRHLGASARALAFPFAGAMGLSVLRDAFGAEGFVQGVIYFAVATLAVATLGRAAARGRWGIEALFGSPIAWSMAGALALVSVPWTPPKFILDTTTLLGHLVVPVMMIAAGVALGRATREEITRGLPSGVARLVIGLLAGIVVAEGLGLEKIARAVVILETATPIAFLWPIYAKESWPSFAASLLVALIALPFVVLYAI